MPIDKSQRKAFLKAIDAAAWDDEFPRMIYADWLDENGEVEESNRQRQYVKSEKWLRAFAREWGFGDEDEEENHTNIESPLGQLIYFLTKHTKSRYNDGEYHLPFMVPEYKTIDGKIYLDYEEVSEKLKELGIDYSSDRLKFHNFDAYSDELWYHFEVVTGIKPPKGKNRKTMPPFRCSC